MKCHRLAPLPTHYWCLLTALACLTGNAAHAQEFGASPYGTTDRQHPFVESMQLMMDAMGMNRGSTGMPESFAAPFGGGWPGSGPGLGQGTPRGSDPWAPQRWMRQFGGQSPQSYADPRRWPQQMQSMWSAIRDLDGDWRGRSGEVLSIRGDRFRIYASRDNYADGQLEIDGAYLILRDSQSQRARRYEFAVHEGRLALRDESGQLLLYRRYDPGRPDSPQSGSH